MEDDSPYDITIARASGPAPVSDECLAGAICDALRRHQTPAAQISVALVDDSRIAELNETHLHHCGPTDVLAFDLRDHAEEETAGVVRGPLEGEIVVSVDTASREAQARGHGFDAELALYVVHGTLHLLGYDDRVEADAVHMHTVEDEILTSIGMGPVYRGARR